MLDRFSDRTLEVSTVIVVVVIFLVILCYLAIYLNPQVFFNPFKPATPVAVVSATSLFQPTWTPTATSTPTDTPTATPTWTPTPTATPTDTPLPPTDTPTATPTATNTPKPPPPPAPPRPTPAPTPWPYDYSSAGGRGDCTRTWVWGYVLGANGLPEAGVQMRVGNNQGWVGDVYTDANGRYEATFDWKPVANRWFVRVFKGGQPRSMQFWWETSAGCDGPYSLQEVQIDWRHR
ncbi:MAG: hypothetical protein GX597_16485 [Anaerolineaceae bacterium]|nr:hypothetical protein [Anaerolineaceae bacterium]